MIRHIPPNARGLPRRHCSVATAVNNRPAGKRVTETFFANVTWLAPVTTTRLEVAAGKGQDGDPGIDATYWYDEHVTTLAQRRDNSGLDTTYDNWTYNISGTAPANYSDPVVLTPDDPTYTGSQTFHEFTQHSDPGEPATTGASTTGFGKTFPGGNGGAASLTNFANVPVTPGGPHALVIPSGGSITFTYFK